MKIDYIENAELKNLESKVIALYDNVGWTTYTENTKSLIEGINNSLYIIYGFLNTELIGLIRVVGDGQTIIYIQDILVKTEYQRLGIGSRLIKMILNRYENVSRIVLITDNNHVSLKFYESIGLKNIKDVPIACFIKG